MPLPVDLEEVFLQLDIDNPWEVEQWLEGSTVPLVEVPFREEEPFQEVARFLMDNIQVHQHLEGHTEGWATRLYLGSRPLSPKGVVEEQQMELHKVTHQEQPAFLLQVELQ